MTDHDDSTINIVVAIIIIINIIISYIICLQCFDAVGCAAGRASSLQKTEFWGAGVVICLERGADLHIVQLMSLPLTHCLLLQ